MVRERHRLEAPGHLAATQVSVASATYAATGHPVLIPAPPSKVMTRHCDGRIYVRVLR